jgi:hypothetical protein
MTLWKLYGVRELPEGNTYEFHHECDDCESAACNIVVANKWLAGNVRYLKL